MLTARQFRLTRDRMLAYLDELDLISEQAVTLYLPPGISGEEAGSYLNRVPAIASISGELTKNVVSARTGSVMFWGVRHKRIVLPPFPQFEKYLASGYDTAPLRNLLTRDWRTGIVLVRLGAYSIGICEGENLILHKTGTGLVHGRHRQGGSSAARFQRRRQDQTDHFLERVAEHIEEKFAPYTKMLDYLVYGGARTTIQELRKHSRFLREFDDRLLPPLLTIPDPGYDVLIQAVKDIWSSHVVEWEEITSDS